MTIGDVTVSIAIHLFYPPKICIGILFRFLMAHLHVPGEMAKNDYAKFLGGKRGVLWDLCK